MRAANTPISSSRSLRRPARCASVTQDAGTFTLVYARHLSGDRRAQPDRPAPRARGRTRGSLRANGTPISSTQTRIANGDNAASYTLQTLVTSTGATDRSV
ncbi:MAG: hypothetical protein ACLVB5_15385 [Christensenellales bacterium]